MKLIVVFSAVFAIPLSIFAGPAPLPKTWGQAFTIDLNSAGGMINRTVNVRFTHDSCTYEERMRGSVKAHAFALTPAQRQQILEKLKSFKLDEVRQVEAMTVTMDKGTESICYKAAGATCLSESAVTSIQAEDRANFSKAYDYLFSFALDKGSPRSKKKK